METKNCKIIIKGNELGENLAGQALRDKAKKYYKKYLANTIHNNPKLGDIKFSASAINKPISASKDEKKLKLLPFLPEIIKTGETSDAMPDKKHRINVKAFYTITKIVNFENQDKKVRITIREDNNGKLYYDHTFAISKKEIHDNLELQ